MIRLPLLAFALVACGCRSNLLDDSRANLASEIAELVDRSRVEADVRAIVDVHLADAPFDCGVFDLEHLDQTRRPVCHLTRDRARALVRQRFESLGLQVSSFITEDGDFQTESVVADLRGTERPEEVVLVGAHFDAFYAGADDNTSGVAAMLEAARVLSQRRFARTIRFVGFDMEEFGLVGSTRYVRGGIGDEEIVTTLVFDCVGYTDHTPGSQLSLPGLPVPDRGDFVALIANDVSAHDAAQLRALAVQLDILPTETVIAGGPGAAQMTGNLMRSDHAPFWLSGYSAIFLTDTANFRNPNYHLDTDTIETLDFDFLTAVTRLSAAGVANWAEEAP